MSELAVALPLCAVVAVEGAHRLPLLRALEAAARQGVATLYAMLAPALSERERERRLRRAAPRLLAATLWLSALLVGWLSMVALAWSAGGAALGLAPGAALSQLGDVVNQVALLACGLLYVQLRRAYSRRRASRLEPRAGGAAGPGEGYSAASQALHRIAFDSDSAQRLAAVVDARVAARYGALPQPRAPVYVAGLARGGTTIVLEALFGSGHFASLTYRSMPFVLAPLTWPPVARSLGGGDGKRPRAHGDGLQISYDSAEAFEEVFWLEHHRDAYVRSDRLLRTEQAPPEVLAAYRGFVARVLRAAELRGTGHPAAVATPGVRYLAKNNNNLLRLAVLRQAFPDARVVVPFRHPGRHAASLLAQHQRFSRLHRQDEFARSYMHWLGHFEFGLGHRPLCVAGDMSGWGSPETLGYWLSYWTSLHEFVLKQERAEVILVDHDRLRRAPGAQLAALAVELGLEPGALDRSVPAIAPPEEPEVRGDLGSEVPAAARDVYDQLLERAL